MGERLITGTAGSYLWSRVPIACSGELVVYAIGDNSSWSSLWEVIRMVPKLELLIVFTCIAFTSGKITVYE